MAWYEFEALDATGGAVSGRMEAESRAAVIARLQEQGHLPIDARPAGRPAAAGRKRGGWRLGGRIGNQDVTEFFRELALLIGAGYQLDQALGVLAENAENPKFAALLDGMKEGLRTGEALSAALEKQPAVFSRLDLGLVKAGEATGALEQVLVRIADYREAAAELRETVAGAMYYPAIVVGAAVLAVVLLLTFVVPEFERLFADAHAILPAPTRMVIAAGHFLHDQGTVLMLAAILVLIGFREALRRPASRRLLDGALLRLPLIGSLAKGAMTARFFQTFGMLLKNGLDLPQALRLSRDSAANLALAEAIDKVIGGVREGRLVAEQMRETNLFPSLAVGILKVGEESGNLSPAAQHVADYYGRRLKVVVKRILTLLEPTLILLVGLFVGGIIFSIIIAVVSLNELAR